LKGARKRSTTLLTHGCYRQAHSGTTASLFSSVARRPGGEKKHVPEGEDFKRGPEAEGMEEERHKKSEGMGDGI